MIGQVARQVRSECFDGLQIFRHSAILEVQVLDMLETLFQGKVVFARGTHTRWSELPRCC